MVSVIVTAVIVCATIAAAIFGGLLTGAVEAAAAITMLGMGLTAVTARAVDG